MNLTPGAVLLAFAAIAGIATLIAPARWRAPLHRAHVGGMLGALLLLAIAFLTTDLGYAYVWGHTRVGYPIAYRLAGVWGGEAGTILLWGAVVAIASLVVARRIDALHARATLLLVGVSTTLATVGSLVDTFAATGDRLGTAPGGRGLADVLLTPLMVIHPPVQFIGYGLMAVPAAFAVASWLGAREAPTARAAWTSAAFPYARVAWWFATFGLGLGALWAYYVLSFGGFWAWDPVETANLLPWLALTVFLHAGKQTELHRELPLTSGLLAFAAFVLTLFATFSTRSGLWVSVHAFTDPTNRFQPDAPARLLAILDAHLPSRLFLGIATAALLAGIALALAHHARHRALRAYAMVLLAFAGLALLSPQTFWGALFAAGGRLGRASIGAGALLGLAVAAPLVLLETAPPRSSERRWLSQRELVTIGAIFLAIALGVVLLLDLQVVDGPQRSLFDERAPFVVLPIVSLLTLTLALPLGRRNAIGLTALGAAMGLLLAWAVPSSRVFALSTPFLLAAVLAALVRLVPERRKRWQVGGWLALALALLFLGANPPTHAGAVALLPASQAIGWGVLFLLAGIAALVGLARQYRPAQRRMMGVWIVHLALAIGLLGFAASTYAQEREVFAARPLGTQVDLGAYALHLGAAQVTRDDRGVEAVYVPLSVERDGAASGEERLSFTWSASAYTYRGGLVVRRTPTEDLYLTPLAFHTSEGWVGADTAASGKIASAEVDAVTFSASVLPLVGLVWTGLWTMLAGMGLIVWEASRRTRASPDP